jgi:hypothetical protein
MGVKIFLRGPMDEFTLPLNPEATEAVTFRKLIPGLTPKQVAQELSDEKALELLTRPRHLTHADFQLLDPADEDRLLPNKKGEIPPSQQLLSNLGGGDAPQTTLPANAPAVEKGAQSDPRKTK